MASYCSILKPCRRCSCRSPVFSTTPVCWREEWTALGSSAWDRGSRTCASFFFCWAKFVPVQRQLVAYCTCLFCRACAKFDTPRASWCWCSCVGVLLVAAPHGSHICGTCRASALRFSGPWGGVAYRQLHTVSRGLRCLAY